MLNLKNSISYHKTVKGTVMWMETVSEIQDLDKQCILMRIEQIRINTKLSRTEDIKTAFVGAIILNI